MIHRFHISRGLQHAEIRDRENFRTHGFFYAIFLRCLRSIGQSKTLGSVGSGPRGLDAWKSRLPSEHREAHEQVHNTTQCASEILPDDKISIFIHLSFNHDKRGRFQLFQRRFSISQPYIPPGRPRQNGRYPRNALTIKQCSKTL